MAVVNIVSYIQALKPVVRDELYQSPWTCQAVLRSLSALAKQYILRMLWLERPMGRGRGGHAVGSHAGNRQLLALPPHPADDIDDWIRSKQAHGRLHQEALDSLEGLGIFQAAAAEGGRAGFKMHSTFQAQLRWSLGGGGMVVHEPTPEVLASAPCMDELDQYAHLQWEALQLYILSNSTDAPKLPAEVAFQELDLHALLVKAGLVYGPQHSRRITQAGFQFLLKDNYRQLWTFLADYIKEAGSRSGSELASVMSFLMQLGFRRVGQPYPFQSLSQNERAIAAHMMQLGLLKPFLPNPEGGKGGGGGRGGSRPLRPEPLHFCPTRLASSLCGGFKPSSVTANPDIAGGHIIVETNYRVYAYTSSRVQVAILELFCRNDCVLPNLFVGTLTRDSVLGAVTSGIPSEQIVSYLNNHASPVIAHRTPPVPEVVTDQIRLWEEETTRVRFAPCFVYDNFESEELYRSSVAFARNQDLLLWCNDERLAFASKDTGHDTIKGFIKSVKEAMELQKLEEGCR